MRLRALLKNRVVLYSLAIYGVFITVLFAASLSGVGGLPQEFPAVEFGLEDVFGGPAVSLAEHQGKPVIIYFFASW